MVEIQIIPPPDPPRPPFKVPLAPPDPSYLAVPSEKYGRGTLF
jgi:hypothetical protein